MATHLHILLPNFPPLVKPYHIRAYPRPSLPARPLMLGLGRPRRHMGKDRCLNDRSGARLQRTPRKVTWPLAAEPKAAACLYRLPGGELPTKWIDLWPLSRL